MNFLAFDTETVNRPGHGEACLLIKWSEKNDAPEFLEFPKSFAEIFDFLKGGNFVAWNADFDIRAICHDAFLPFDVVERLGLFGRAEFGKFRFRYIPGKFLEVFGPGECFRIFDLKQFYGGGKLADNAKPT